MPNPNTPARVSDDQRWRTDAACAPGGGHDPETFFPPPARPYSTRSEQHAARQRRHRIESAAKAICATCPVTVECLQYADDNDEREGVWGGLTPTERGKTPLR